MSAVDTIISNARVSTGTNTTQLTAANGIIFLNNVYKDLCEAILQIDERYFYTEWAIDAVADQAEYAFTAHVAATIGLKKLLRLEMKMSTNDTYFRPCREVDITNLELDWDYYQANQPMDDPIYYLSDTGFFIAPVFTSTTTAGGDNDQIKVYGEGSRIDLVAGGAEGTVLIDRDYHWLLSLGMEYWIHKSKQKSEEARLSLEEYNLKKAEMLNNLSNRNHSVGFAAMPSTANLE